MTPTPDTAEPARHTAQTIIRIAAVVIRNPQGHILSVRKRHTSAFMLPGGKLEPGEDGLSAACREIKEELGLDLAASDMRSLGRCEAPAANEPNCLVVCDLFVWARTLDALPPVAAEIAEAEWTDPTLPRPDIAPLSRDVVFPQLDSLLA